MKTALRNTLSVDSASKADFRSNFYLGLEIGGFRVLKIAALNIYLGLAIF